jgi:hypothetical protein
LVAALIFNDMNIKKLTHKIAFAILLIAVTSCKKDITQFLETPPGVSLDEDKVFSSQQEIELYMSTGYALSIPTFMGWRNGIPGGSTFFSASATSPSGVLPRQAQTIFAGATDEAESTADFVPTQQFNTGSILPQNIINFEDHWYFARFRGIRVANILLERIDAAPVDNAYKIQVKAEAKFLRAMNNFEMFKRYGGFQIINKRITAQESNSIPRSSVEDCVNFIVKDLDEAFAELPTGFPVAAQKGRVNKTAIAALKSRTLLYAASPLFNTATPYISFSNNNLICYGNFNNQRWKLAADAALVALNTAALGSEGFELLDNTAKRNPPAVNGRTRTFNGVSTAVGGQVLGNYREAWEQPDNNEIILAFKGYGNSGRFGYPWQHVLPNNPRFDGFFSGTAVNHRFIKRYETKKGVDQVWPASGNDLTQKYSELDARFAQTVGYNGSRFSNNQTRLELYEGGIHLPNCRTGAWMKKLVPDLVYTGNVVPIISVFRYNELLLNLAEALNEFSGPAESQSIAPSLSLVTATNATLAAYINNFQYPLIPVSPYDIINKIRLRSGMPPLPPNLDKNAFRIKLQNERAIELAFENYRFWDVRRWLIAENDGILNGNVLRLIIRPINISLDQFSYEEQIVEPRTFQKRLYLYPYDFNEIQRNPSIIQNPGW